MSRIVGVTHSIKDHKRTGFTQSIMNKTFNIYIKEKYKQPHHVLCGQTWQPEHISRITAFTNYSFFLSFHLVFHSHKNS